MKGVFLSMGELVVNYNGELKIGDRVFLREEDTKGTVIDVNNYIMMLYLSVKDEDGK